MPIELLMPALSPTMEEGTLAKWSIAEGDPVSAGDVIAEIETDKATMEFEAIDDGILHRILIAEGSEGVRVNTPIAIILSDGESADDVSDQSKKPMAPVPTPLSSAPETSPPQPDGAATKPARGTRIFASPLARRIAAERGIDLATLHGSGPHGRIVRADLEKAPASQPLASTPPAMDPNTITALYAGRDFVEIPLDGMRKTIAARLTEAKQTIPHFYLRREIRLDALLKLRKEINAGLDAEGAKISVNDFIIKASAVALQQAPDCNVVWAGNRILKLRPSDIAVAVAIEGGLITPIVTDADVKSLTVISSEMRDLAARARSRKLLPHEYQGGGFSISNLGMMGIENFDAVINPPQGSILAVGAGLAKPVVADDGQIAIETRMSVTLSVDHRMIDGAMGADFLQKLTGLIENPVRMLV